MQRKGTPKLDMDQHFDHLSLQDANAPKSAFPQPQRSRSNLPFPPPSAPRQSPSEPASADATPPLGQPQPLPFLPRANLSRSNSQPITSTRPRRPNLNLTQLGVKPAESPFANFSKYVDPSGKLNFAGKAIIHAEGVDFSNGNSFNIRMDDLVLEKELGHGHYGTVQKVYHKRSKVVMAMKEIRLELDEKKLQQILMELDVLHKSTSQYIVEFYGAFFIETCVYYCMEFMDAGSLDTLYHYGVPEPVLSVIAMSMVNGLKFLKEELSIIHRDIKPTNILMNQKGQVKLCDFGVSGQLEKSLAKTNIGSQSYMAPERITNSTTSYTVASDVWSVGVALLEMAVRKFPFKSENMFAQLKAIIEDPPPNLPDCYSSVTKDFIYRCLEKDPVKRPTYAELLEHPFITTHNEPDVDMKGWVKEAMAYCQSSKEKE
ncbi:kinase-like protein [Hesseltinella vesiculosa]|uniref:mitogen-activated protein kinase kinase n=1 Tax=Hesseltinella vesiculosa TaxID=101127 RepID=A0A1X2GIK8_9FUNG|nr:kinase-like protein [Hesseltinella vesiculosa]